MNFEYEQPTQQQIDAVKKCKCKSFDMSSKKIIETYVYPCCGVEVLGTPIIENAGEELTQIRCQYGCGFIYIENYI